MISKLRRAGADLAVMNQLLPDAERIALAEGIDQPGAEHLLLAALDLDDRVAVDALAAVGVAPEQLRVAIDTQHADALRSVGLEADEELMATGAGGASPSGPGPAPAGGVYRSQGSLQTLFQEAVGLAKRDRVPLTSGHVLIAALETQYGTLARTFDRLGVDRSRLEHITRELIAATGWAAR